MAAIITTPFRVLNAENFKEDFEKVKKDIPAEFRPDMQIEERQNFGTLFLNYGFVIALIAGFWILLRRMTGGGPGGQIFNIGKSKATLFDNTNTLDVTTVAEVANGVLPTKYDKWRRWIF